MQKGRSRERPFQPARAQRLLPAAIRGARPRWGPKVGAVRSLEPEGAEAELGALVKASAEAIGVAQMAIGFGSEVEVQVMVDSSAALAVTQRKGNGN